MKVISEVLFRVYLALVSIITIFILLVNMGLLLDTGLRTYVFTAANEPSWLPNCEYDSPYKEFDNDGNEIAISEEEQKAECESRLERERQSFKNQKANQAVSALSFLIVTFPIFFIHFLVFFKDWKRSKK